MSEPANTRGLPPLRYAGVECPKCQGQMFPNWHPVELSCVQCGHYRYTPLSAGETGRRARGYAADISHEASRRLNPEVLEVTPRLSRATARLTALARELGLTPGDPEEPWLLELAGGLQ